ncbi:hypothetical protein Taro_012422 [Colocasia esculenta]|uniref:Uncharacterized protein n=1 Tax=Colocasia esculenta TaxID=4460 RepID=A0A843UDG9_COLES|nr:hypothetical protein [Colocasia esculenta]
MRPQLGQAAVLRELVCFCGGSVSPFAGVEAGARLASRARGLWVPLLAASSGGLVTVVVTTFPRDIPSVPRCPSCTTVIAWLCLVSVGIVGLALGRPMFLVVPALVFSRFRGPILVCQPVFGSVGGGATLGVPGEGSERSGRVRLPCMIHARVAGCSCCCAACVASVVARHVRAVAARLALDSLAVVFLVWRTLASQSSEVLLEFFSIGSGGSENGALVVLVEVLPGLACVASAVLLAVVFSLMVRIVWVVLSGEAPSQDRSLSFWRRFFPEVFYVRFGLPLGCPCGSKCAVWLGCILHRVLVLEHFGFVPSGALVHCVVPCLLGVGGFELSASGTSLSVVRQALVVTCVQSELLAGISCVAVGNCVLCRVLLATERVADLLVPTARSVGGCIHVVFGWLFPLFGLDLASLSTGAVVVPSGRPFVWLELSPFPGTPILGSPLRESSLVWVWDAEGFGVLSWRKLDNPLSHCLSLRWFRSHVVVPGMRPQLGQAAVLRELVCFYGGSISPFAGVEAGARLARRARGLRVPLLAASGGVLIVVVVTTFPHDVPSVPRCPSCTAVTAWLCLVFVGIVGLALGRPVFLVVPASVFSRFRGPILVCQLVMAPACVASQPGGVSGVWGGSACGTSTL